MSKIFDLGGVLGSLYRRYLLPGFIFQGVVIGGGYATGRELAEFFFPAGPIGGLLGLLVSALIWSVVMAISFELCRLFRSYDYRTFFKELLGPAWFVYEVLLLALMVLALSVMGAASGEIVGKWTGLPDIFGILFLLIAISTLASYGLKFIDKFMGIWSISLYLCFLSLVIICLLNFGSDILDAFRSSDTVDGWLSGGVRYAGYNIAVVPTVFFCLSGIATRKESVIAGLLAGPIAILPGIFLFTAMMSDYPAIGSVSIPSTHLLEMIGSAWFSVVFQIVLLGTFVQTGVGLIHSVNRRVATSLSESGYYPSQTFFAILSLAILTIALAMGTMFGLKSIIANGYGLLTFGFLAVFVLPVLTIGIYKFWTLSAPQKVDQTIPTIGVNL